MSKTKNSATMIIVAICLTSFMGDCINGWNPIIDNVANAFPDVSYTAILYVSTLPNLTCVIIALIAGALVGKRLRYRTAIITGCLFILVSGVLPAFFHDSFAMILIMRGIFGLGLGLLLTLGGYVCELFEGKERQRALGLRTASLNTGSVVLLLLAGFLGDIYWPYASYSFLIAIIPLVAAIFFLKEPSDIKKAAVSESEAPAAAVSAEKGKLKITGTLVLSNVVIIVLTCVAYAVLLIISTFMTENNLGTAADAGVLLAVYTGGGIAAGLIYEKVRIVFKSYFAAINIFIWAIGAALIYFSGNLIIANIGAFIAGCAWYGVLTIYTEKAPDTVNDATKSFAGTSIFISSYLGCFIGGYWTSLVTAVFGSTVKGCFYGVFIVFTAAAVLSAITTTAKSRQTKA